MWPIGDSLDAVFLPSTVFIRLYRYGTSKLVMFQPVIIVGWISSSKSRNFSNRIFSVWHEMIFRSPFFSVFTLDFLSKTRMVYSFTVESWNAIDVISLLPNCGSGVPVIISTSISTVKILWPTDIISLSWYISTKIRVVSATSDSNSAGSFFTKSVTFVSLSPWIDRCLPLLSLRYAYGV